MATVGELAVAVEEALRDRGITEELQARLHTEIYCAIAGEESATVARAAPKEVLVLNALIKEYLQVTGFSNTAKVFSLETGADTIPRELLKAQLKVQVPLESESTPLLHSLIFGKINK